MDNSIINILKGESADREIVLRVALSYLGTFYRWGGDDPQGFDCSGLVVECMKSIGKISRKLDFTANTMFTRWANGRVDTPEPGDLVFWHSKVNSLHITHVEIALNDRLAIGASGGGSKTRTIQDAIDQNAFIKIRPFRSRGNLKAFINPYKQDKL